MGDQQPGTGEGQGSTETTGGAATGPGVDGREAGTAEPDLAAEVAKWKDLARQNEARAKANAEAAIKLQQIEESQKSEQQKLADRAQDAERRAAEAELRMLRLEVAAGKGVPAQLAARLSGSTREELEADADDLLAHLKPKQQQRTAPAGMTGNSEDGKSRPEDYFAPLAGR